MTSATCFSMDDERGMAAGDFRRLSMDPGCERPLGLRREDFVLRADDIERRLVMPGHDVDRGFERNVIQGKLRVGQVRGDLRRKVGRDGDGNAFGSMYKLPLASGWIALAPSVGGPGFASDARESPLPARRRKRRRRESLGSLSLADHRAAPGVADQYGPPVLLRERLFGPSSSAASNVSGFSTSVTL